ncbi:Transcriptional regulator of nonfermentable carbon utilization [Arthrobotrys musiformis]|uniref:Transcriptional regulator of nonfermentable carbon utilization n=1 Tax=Arthrobotrys musiformis TaxID=47236 RepID=A0AAV9WHN9_9PEZI
MSSVNNGTTSPTAVKVSSKTSLSAAAAKDPSRPRRKKARRACHACQRAHLTCGDERPCQRCIKRGLQDLCADGVRKKAKYLHDAPIDTPPKDHLRTTQVQKQTPSNPGIYTGDGTINPLSMDQTPDLLTPQIGTTAEANLGLGTMPQSSQNPQQQQQFGNPPFFDPADPSIYNFDIASLNFGSHYGALEFGMLGHMTGGGANATTPESNGSGNNYQQQTPFSPSGGPAYLALGDTGFMGDWSNSRQNSTGNILSGTTSAHPNHAFTVTNGPGSGLTSPSPPLPSPKHPSTLYDINVPPATASPPMSVANFYSPATARPLNYENIFNHGHQTAMPAPLAKPVHPPPTARRPKDPSTLYTTVTKPYSYTAGFHRLLVVLRNRFPPPLLNRIARSMASYRPSFIACTKTLKEEDLLFMEKCFQRTLWEYEKFIGQCGTPTIVCRRTGEIAAVGKEFCHLTSWPKDVLLGKTQNLNTNFGNSNLGEREQQIIFGQQTHNAGTEQNPKPVFLAELLDQESVVEFYEQFAKLAFGDARGSVMTKCKLLKYLPAEVSATDDAGKRRKTGTSTPVRGPTTQMSRNGVVGESGLDSLAKDGKVDCTFCWTVKRDMFDIPMLIIGNFLPILQGHLS